MGDYELGNFRYGSWVSSATMLLLVLFLLVGCGGRRLQGEVSPAASRAQVEASTALTTELPTPTPLLPSPTATQTPLSPSPTATQTPLAATATATSSPRARPVASPAPTATPRRSQPTATPLASQLTTGAAEGKHLFLTVGCALCHTIDGVSNGNQGPNLTHITTKPYDHLPNDPAFLRRWIKNPQAIKPGTLMPDLGLTDQQVRDIVAYLESPQK